MSSALTLHRPPLSGSAVPDLVNSLYGLHVEVVQELHSYDDLNFHLMVIPGTSVPDTVGSLCPHGYTLKILNSLDSAKHQVLDITTQVILLLCKNNYPTPKLILNLKKQYRTLIEFPKIDSAGDEVTKHDVCLLEFLPGTVMSSVENTSLLCYEVGFYAGLLDVILKDLSIENKSVLSLMTRKWNLTEVPALRSNLQLVSSDDTFSMMTEVLDQFQAKILDQQHQFSKGMIHSDFNDANLLVSQEKAKLRTNIPKNYHKDTVKGIDPNTSTPSQTCTDHAQSLKQGTEETSSTDLPFHICGVLDYGDVTWSLYIFEVSIAMTYAMLTPGSLTPVCAAHHVLAGYLQHVKFSPLELNSLKLCICARLLQSYVIGYMSALQEPDNEYLLFHAKRTLPLLVQLWNTSDEEAQKQFLHPS